MKWEKIRFAELFSVPSRNGLTRPAKVRGIGYKMINMGELFAHDWIYSIPMERVQLSEREKRECLVNKGDLLFARQSLVESGAGKCSIVRDVDEPTTFESHLIRIRLNEEKANPLFYYYYFHSPRSPMRSIVNVCAQAGIRGSDLCELYVDYPQIGQQHRIASILSTYDDLIENNRRQIKLLEEAAQRLYREWFVELRFPGHENVKIVDGVPEGWQAETIGNVCCTIGGGTPSTKEKTYYEGGNIPWVTPTDITRNGCLILLETEKKITEEGLAHSSAKMVPAWTILMTSRASVGYFGICEFPVCTNQGFISCIPYQENMRFYLLHNLMNRVDEIRAKAGGSTYLEISKSTFRDMKIIVPADEILNSFEESIQKLMMKMKNCKEQNRILTSARDRLLPKLMSGEVEV